MGKTTVEMFSADPARIPEPDDKFLCIVTRPPAPERTLTPDGSLTAVNLNRHLSLMEQYATEWIRLLNGEGLLWLNLADIEIHTISQHTQYRYRSVAGEGKHFKQPAQFANLPHKILDVFTSCGWLYRSSIIWDRLDPPKGMSRSSRKIEPKHEYLFMLAKERSHRFYGDRLIDRGSIWSIPSSTGHKHRETFPVELPRRCIPLSTQRYEWVLDPCSNIDNTTGTAAKQLGCNAVSYTPSRPDLEKTA